MEFLIRVENYVSIYYLHRWNIEYPIIKPPLTISWYTRELCESFIFFCFRVNWPQGKKENWLLNDNIQIYTIACTYNIHSVIQYPKLTHYFTSLCQFLQINCLISIIVDCFIITTCHHYYCKIEVFYLKIGFTCLKTIIKPNFKWF